MVAVDLAGDPAIVDPLTTAIGADEGFTSAALIMVSVFLGFALGADPTTKIMGLGLATAILVDATVVRVVLVPATMKLTGSANWWLPASLGRRMPNIEIEGPADSGALAPIGGGVRAATNTTFR